ncbi:MAG: hypothetical protein GY862_14600, partial [Gammaproteobacteria bacterium]|nr:hypothetical protein [Gammaproteobacteria bacterium]
MSLQGTTAGHNVGVRKEIINAAIREISALESERKELSEQIRSIKNKKIKGDLNMKITD